MHRGVEIGEKVIKYIRSTETIIGPHKNPIVFLKHHNTNTILPYFPLRPLKILTLHESSSSKLPSLLKFSLCFSSVVAAAATIHFGSFTTTPLIGATIELCPQDRV
ncbi:hypothetical protein JHK82_025900 [Glycine max]|nr:hypothetical protein JHK85_026509 [Glycine max]KAG5134712.1 hypothetical protein JHK82_025900 [Glycine max]